MMPLAGEGVSPGGGEGGEGTGIRRGINFSLLGDG